MFVYYQGPSELQLKYNRLNTMRGKTEHVWIDYKINEDVLKVTDTYRSKFEALTKLDSTHNGIRRKKLLSLSKNYIPHGPR